MRVIIDRQLLIDAVLPLLAESDSDILMELDCGGVLSYGEVVLNVDDSQHKTFQLDISALGRSAEFF